MRRLRVMVLALVLVGCTLIGDDEVDALVGEAGDTGAVDDVETGETDTTPDETDPPAEDSDTALDDTDTAPDDTDTAPEDTDTAAEDTDTGAEDTDTGAEDTDTGAEDTDTAPDPIDEDGDGYAVEDDCDDTSAAVHPGAAELPYDDLDNDCDPATPDDDLDADGYGRASDCLDSDASVNPAAVEVPYDGLDNDCNGLTLDDDLDADGFPLAEDCDDAASTVSPGAAEVCDGVDEDCDGVVDDDALDASTFYADDDADGFGDAGSPLLACELPIGATEDVTDCDDNDAAVNPAVTEACNGVDDDCDGLIDLDDTSFVADLNDTDCDGLIDWLDLADAPTSFTGEAVGDRAMNPAMGDFNGDEIADLAIGARYHAAAGTWAGAVYVFYGPLSGPYADADADVKVTGVDSGDYAGVAMDAGWDLTGDSVDELLVSAPGAEGVGVVYVLSEPADGDLSAAILTLVGLETNGFTGASAAFSPDIDGDGYADILVSAGADDTNGTSAGAAYVVSGTERGRVTLDSVVTLYGEAANDAAGDSVDAAGDVNGDGYGDVIAGAEGTDFEGSSSGSAYIVFGPIPATMDFADADAIIVGESTYDHLGETVAGAGDPNNDGYGDVAVVAEPGSKNTTVSVFDGPLYGSFGLSDADASIEASTASTQAGYSLGSAGDVDGDGATDLLIGAYGLATRTDWEGGAWILLGPLSGALSSDDADVTLLGGSTYDMAGKDVTSAGDIDGDDRSEVLIGGELGTSASDGYGVVYLLDLANGA